MAKRLFRDVSYLSYHFKLEDDAFYLNLNHEEWFNIKDISMKSRESFLDLYSKVITKSVKIIEEVHDYIFLDQKVNLEKLFENKSYSNGLVLK